VPCLQEDIFFITFADLGDLSEVEIEHDNSGLSPGWHCQEVCVHGWLGGGGVIMMRRGPVHVLGCKYMVQAVKSVTGLNSYSY
jgi:hypothetical protein